jgi:hypothetical protein
MSSSFRNSAIALAILASAASVVQAQQAYFLPTFESTAEWHDNRDLASDPAFKKANGIYVARAEALIGRVDRRSSLELRPWISYQEVPDRTDTEPLELGVNFRSDFDTTKAEYHMNARYMRRDTITAEYGSAGYDTYDPANTPAGDTGIVSTTGTRTDWSVYPNMTYNFSERTRLDARVSYNHVGYNTNVSLRRVGYDSSLVEATVVHRMTQRFEAIAGPYVARYESDDGSNNTDSYGLVLGTGYAPAESSYVIAQLRAERSDVSSVLLPGTPAATRVDQKQTTVGFEVNGYYGWPSSSVRFDLGRFLEPSTIGSRITNDVVRVQYTRALSARLSAIGAVRYTRDNRIEDANLAGTNKRLFGDLTLYWQLTPTWYLGGGYRYLRQDLASETRNADDQSVFLQFGYRALDPRPRRAQ